LLSALRQDSLIPIGMGLTLGSTRNPIYSS